MEAELSPRAVLRSAWWRVKLHAKAVLRFCLFWSGIAPVYGRLFGRRRGVILCYHSAGTTSGLTYPSNILSEDVFRRQMGHIRRTRSVVPLDRIVESMHAGATKDPGAVALTFDDGYKSNLDTVVPVLREHGFPATFFVIPGLIDRGEGKWDDILYFAMKPFRKAVFRRHRDEVNKALQEAERSTEALRLAQVKAACAEALMSWGDLRSLRDLGFSVQSHGMNHYYLSAQPDDVQQHELAESRKRIEQELGTEVAYFAYPFGVPGSYTEQTKVHARCAGYRAAFSGENGYEEDSRDLFAIRRMTIGKNTPLWQFKLMLTGLYFD